MASAKQRAARERFKRAAESCRREGANKRGRRAWSNCVGAKLRGTKNRRMPG